MGGRDAWLRSLMHGVASPPASVAWEDGKAGRYAGASVNDATRRCGKRRWKRWRWARTHGWVRCVASRRSLIALRIQSAAAAWKDGKAGRCAQAPTLIRETASSVRPIPSLADVNACTRRLYYTLVNVKCQTCHCSSAPLAHPCMSLSSVALAACV